MRFTAGPTRTIGLDATAIATVQQCARRQLLRFFVRRGLLQGDDARAMRQGEPGDGPFVDASVRVEAADRVGRERLLRYCARPPFALERRLLAELGLVVDGPTRSCLPHPEKLRFAAADLRADPCATTGGREPIH